MYVYTTQCTVSYHKSLFSLPFRPYINQARVLWSKDSSHKTLIYFINLVISSIVLLCEIEEKSNTKFKVAFILNAVFVFCIKQRKQTICHMQCDLIAVMLEG